MENTLAEKDSRPPTASQRQPEANGDLMSDPPTPPRYLPDEPLPGYAYVPTAGWPHPIRDPEGHLHGLPEEKPHWQGPGAWRSCQEYLRGVDLFNHGYYWEAHEEWEALWHAAGRDTANADFFKALIKLAAAALKAREGRPAGVRRHAAAAAELFKEIRPLLCGAGEAHMGLRLSQLRDWAEEVAQRADALVDTRPADVLRTAPFVLTPAGE